MKHVNNISKVQVEQAIERLAQICESVPAQLKAIPLKDLEFKPAPHKWSKKEVIGHLIDSATNNHHRFVRAQFDVLPAIQYDQDKWNQFGYYQIMEAGHLIDFWYLYNLHLVELMRRIPETLYKNEVQVKGEVYELDFLMVDYVDHLEHHLRQII